MKKLRLTVEYTAAGKASEMSKDLDPEVLHLGLPDYIRRLSMTKEVAALYITRADCLQFVPIKDT